MGKIDLSKDISLQDLKNIDIKKALKKKKAVLPSKKGINLVPPKKNKKNNLLKILGAVAGLLVIGAVCYFGIYKPMDALATAQSEYDTVHEEYVRTTEAVGDYDAVLKEYHSYSLDWMEKEKGHRYVSVPRETILEMVDEKIVPCGTLNSLQIAAGTLTVRMSDMNLDDITQMLSKVEEEPFVSYAFLQQAVSQENKTVTVNEKGEEVVTTLPETVVFTVTVNLQAPVEEDAQ